MRSGRTTSPVTLPKPARRSSRPRPRVSGAVRYVRSEWVPDTGGSMAGENPGVMASGGESPPFDTSVAHVARVYNFWLGGKDNFAADRAAGEQAIKAFPEIPLSARSNRAFLARAVRFLAGEAGIGQFLDVGTGIPSANNTHEVAQSAAPTTSMPTCGIPSRSWHRRDGCWTSAARSR